MKHGGLTLEQLLSAQLRAEKRVRMARAANMSAEYIDKRMSALKSAKTRIKHYRDREAGVTDHFDPAKRAAAMPTEIQR